MNLKILSSSCVLVKPSYLSLGYLILKIVKHKLHQYFFELIKSSPERLLALKIDETRELMIALTQLYKKKAQITQTQKSQISLSSIPLTNTIQQNLLYISQQYNITHTNELFLYTLKRNSEVSKAQVCYRLGLLRVEYNSRGMKMHMLFNYWRKLGLLSVLNYVFVQLHRLYCLDLYFSINLLKELIANQFSSNCFLLGCIRSSGRPMNNTKSLLILNILVNKNKNTQSMKRCFRKWLGSSNYRIITQGERNLQLTKLVEKLNTRVTGYYATALYNIYNGSKIKRKRVNFRLATYKVLPYIN